MLTMREEELNMVAGGYVDDTCGDSRALYDTGYMKEQFEFLEMLFHWCTDSAKVDAGWARAGITSVTHFSSNNEYYFLGRRIPRRDAMKLIGLK